MSPIPAEGIELAKLYDYDLILLDLSLPDMDGYDVLRKLRLARIDTPTLILTGLDGTESKLKGFGAGADDYLTKPFDREELIARIHAIVRRSKGHAQSSSIQVLLRSISTPRRSRRTGIRCI
jgi:two-component system cell cycle response regulator CtrA